MLVLGGSQLTFTQFRGMVEEGGNGRALLYCKYDSAGNILQVSLYRKCAVVESCHGLALSHSAIRESSMLTGDVFSV